MSFVIYLPTLSLFYTKMITQIRKLKLFMVILDSWFPKTLISVINRCGFLPSPSNIPIASLSELL